VTSYAAPCCPNVCDDNNGPCGLPSDFPTTFTFSSSFKVGMRNAHPPFSTNGTQFTYQVSMTSRYEFQGDLCNFYRTSLVASHEYRCINSPPGSNYPGDFSERKEVSNDSSNLMFWGRANGDARVVIDYHDSQGNPQYEFRFANNSNTEMERISESVPQGTPFIEVTDVVSSVWTARKSGQLNAFFRGRGSNHGVKLFFPSSIVLPNGDTVPDLRDEPFAERFTQAPTEANGSSGSMTPFSARYGAINGGGEVLFPWFDYDTGISPPRFHLDRKPTHLDAGYDVFGGGGGNICPLPTGFKRPGNPPFSEWEDLSLIADGEYYEYGVRMGLITNITEDSRVSFGFS